MTEELPPTEEELRAAYEAEIKKVRVEQLVFENIVSLVNLGMRRTGLAPGTEDERDLGQVRLAIEAVRALLPSLEQIAPQQIAPIRDALSQLQLAYVKIGGQPAPQEPAAGEPGGGASGAPPGGRAGGQSQSEPGGRVGGEPQSEPTKPDEAGPAQRSGRLWVPGQ